MDGMDSTRRIEGKTSTIYVNGIDVSSLITECFLKSGPMCSEAIITSTDDIGVNDKYDHMGMPVVGVKQTVKVLGSGHPLFDSFPETNTYYIWPEMYGVIESLEIG